MADDDAQGPRKLLKRQLNAAIIIPSMPDAVIVHNKLAWAHTLNGNDRLALSFYNQALALDAFSPFSLFHLGQYYYIIGDRRRANEYFERLYSADKTGEYSQKAHELVEGTL